ncbi:hypothetical protein [Sulfurimonas sp.]
MKKRSINKIYLYCVIGFLVVGLAGCAGDSPQTISQPLPKTHIKEKKVKPKTKYKLTVDAPQGATIKIMNIKSKYHDNIELKKGKYHIVVTKSGYKKYDAWITLEDDKNYVVRLKKVALPKIKQNYFKYVKNIDWSYNNERFSLIYDEKNKLIWALQSAYVDFVKKNHPKAAVNILDTYKIGNECYKQLYFKFDTIVYTGDYRTNKSRYYRFSDNNKLAIYYKSKYKKSSIKKPFGALKNLKVNGMQNSWRIPTRLEIKRNNPFKEYQKYFEIHFGSGYYSPPYMGQESRISNLSIVITDNVRGVRDGYVWVYKRDKNGLYTIANKYLVKGEYLDSFSSEINNISFILPVRQVSSKYDKIIFNKHYTPEQKLAYLTSKLTEEELHVSKKKIKKPKKIPYVKPKKLQKGEFEKSDDFNKRVEAYKQKIKAKNKDIDKKNSQALQEYSKALEAEDIRYNKLKKHNSSPKVIAKTANLMAQKAMRMIFGDPKFSDISYDADKELFVATLYSSSNNLNMKVKIPVSISKAKEFKANILNDKLVPVVSFSIKNNKLYFDNLKIITNETKIENDLAFAKEKDTPQVYKAFLEEYPHYKGRKQVEKLLQNVIEKEAYDNASSSLTALEAFIQKYPLSKYTKKAKQDIQKIKDRQKREDEAYVKKQAAYNSIKRVGDTVCKDGTTSFILSITMKAYVERVNGDNIQLRIADTEGTRPYYNGVKLYKNTLIWDRYNNWYKCK